MKMRRITYLFAILLVLYFIPGCDDSIAPDDLDNRPIPDSSISFSQHIQPVLEFKCVPCHYGGNSQGNIRLETWSDVINPLITTIYDPDNSRLVWVVEGRPGVAIMPPVASPYPPFTSRQLFGLRKWIEEGAKDN